MVRKVKKAREYQAKPLWYKDAVIYQVHVKAFCDSDGDGVGDFKGLTSKLDYLQDLGVTAIWLLPFCPSPMKDDGYDIADYMGIHPEYGTLGDFRVFLREAHRRNLSVITELVVNHTSDQHPWFQKARRARSGNRWRDFYVWSDTPDLYKETRIIFQDFETSNWSWDRVAKAYYWHRFYSHQPDLNYENPQVQSAILKVLDHWLDMGVDGLRLDAVPYLYEREGTNCENLPETHAFLKRMRAHVDGKFENRMLLGEANQWPEDASAYFGEGDECHMAFHFPLMPRMFMAIRMEDRFPIVDILAQTPTIPEVCQWAIFLRNHDELTLEMVTDEERDYMYRVYAQDPRARINLGIRRRLAPLLANNRRRIELMSSLLCSMPGTPVLYYGDEIGMGDNVYLGDRNGVRTPMQWSADRNAGFSRSNPQKLYLPIIIDPEYHYETINVEAQQANHQSLLWWMKRLIALRKRFKPFCRGAIDFLDPENYKILAFIRRYEEEQVLVVANLSRFVQYVELDLSAY
ncbi:MAG: maltose alpha-D-glucosyltransferase, partial [Desulfatiglandales bacterium]